MTLENLRNIAQEMGRKAFQGLVVLLHGELGTGKTTFVRFFAEGFGIDPKLIRSPSFNIIFVYRKGDMELVHADLYRLNEEKEIFHTGLPEYMGRDSTVVLIEWAEKLGRYTPENHVKLRLEFESEYERTLIIETKGDKERKYMEKVLEVACIGEKIGETQ